MVKIKSLVTQIQDQGSKNEIHKELHKLNFKKQRHKLNNILLSQYMISNGHMINQADLQQIQNTDRFVAALKQGCLNGHQGFLLKNGVLYKKSKVLGQEIYKLVLPEGLSRQVLFSIHLKNETHQNAG